jgi:hypothetical protein
MAVPMTSAHGWYNGEPLRARVVKQWGYIRSYVIKDGHLFLALMAGGGIYEFEPVGSYRM